MAVDQSKVSVPNPVMRNKVADYLKVNDKYVLMGVYAVLLLVFFQNEFPYTADMIISEAAVVALYKCGRDHLTGTDAMFQYVRVDLFDPVEGEANNYKAREFIVSNEVSGNTGNGGDPLTLAGTLKCVGDPVFGTFNTTTAEFTPDEDAASGEETN